MLKADHYKQKKQLLEQEIYALSLSKPTFFQRIFHKKRDKRLQLEGQLKELTMKIKIEEKELSLLQKRSNQMRLELNSFWDSINNKYNKQGLVIPDDHYWSDTQSTYEYRQLNTPWLTDELNFERGLLF
ncbi:hypothetical protein JR311_19640 [Bacillus velezensis]|uniref:hypothetical protein n=1 Tax=Bacillus velezensis TaxID=492670 RepID=UPI001959C86B|nr:hypothetical protein [Bacillus velezensis]QRV09402.1 hypothetical protein JR311_19640 [Bacillus velezensis]